MRAINEAHVPCNNVCTVQERNALRITPQRDIFVQELYRYGNARQVSRQSTTGCQGMRSVMLVLLFGWGFELFVSVRIFLSKRAHRAVGLGVGILL